MWLPLGLMVIREAFVGITSVLAVKKTGRVEGAEFHGKVATVCLYVMVGVHLLFADKLTDITSNTLIGVTTVIMIVSFVLYAKKNIGILRNS